MTTQEYIAWLLTLSLAATDVHAALSPRALAPLLHWRVCHVWDFLTFGQMPGYALYHGLPMAGVAEVYGGDEAEEMNARTGCIGCPLATKDTALDYVLSQHKWSYMAPLKQLRPLYTELRSFRRRSQNGRCGLTGTAVRRGRGRGGMKIATISYAGSPIRVAVALPVSNWCPVTHEPQAGSTVTFRYTPDARLLDILDLAWLAPDGEWPRDLEAAAAYLHQQAVTALGVSVSLVARFILTSGVIVECRV